MKDKKITFKYFSIAEYEKEEAYLRKMHQQGWKLVKISLHYLCPCLFLKSVSRRM